MPRALYLADTSVWVLRFRHEVVKDRCDGLMLAGRLGLCQTTALEFLSAAPDPQVYAELRKWMDGLLRMDVTADAMRRAVDVHAKLAEKDWHRDFRLPALVTAATAEIHGVSLLHYDRDFVRIAEITGQPHEWVAPRGSL